MPIGAVTAPLPDVVDGVREAVLVALADVSGVEEVVYGERQRIGSFKMPALWVVPESYAPQVSGGHTAVHAIPYSVVALVKGSQPQEDLKSAERYAAAAYDALMSDRSLGGLVSDVRPAQIDPGYEAGNNTRVCYAAVRVECILRRRE